MTHEDHPAVWSIVEERFDPAAARSYEGLFTLGSGYLHVRGSVEEHFANAPQNMEYIRDPLTGSGEPFRRAVAQWGTYIPGVYGHHPLLNTELINLPYFLGLAPIIDGERLDGRTSDIEAWRRVLRLDTASLHRTVRWRTASGKRVEARFDRFISAARPHLSVQRMTLRSDAPAEAVIEAGLDADVRTNGYDHFKAILMEPVGEAGLACRLRTDAGDRVEVRTRLALSEEAEISREVATRTATLRAELALSAGHVLTVEKRSAIATSLDGDERGAEDYLKEAAGKPYEELFEEHRRVWEERWRRSDVEVDGDESSQQALRAALYHLHRAHPGRDAKVSIDAKGYAGEAYWGRFFWDSEVYLLPFYLYTDPPLARTLTRFRVCTLTGAKANAARYRYEGARYPWEADHRGAECCPAWQYRDLQVHVTADVAFALAHDVAATGDCEFLEREAAKVWVETARYWVSRIDRREGDDRPHLLGVMGPDEFTMLSSNNAFTNRMASLNLNLAAQYGHHGGATEEERREFVRIAEGLTIPRLRAADGKGPDLVLQCEEWPHLAEFPFDEQWTDRTRSIAGQVKLERLFRSRVSKQADALLLMALFPQEFTDAEVRRAWDEYVPRTAHDSSLSAGVHALVALRLNLDDDALEYWRVGARVDLDRHYGGAAEGLHIAAAGATWTVAVLGFAGMKSALHRRVLTLSPRLPRAWTRMAFRVVWRGHPVRVEVTHDHVTLTSLMSPDEAELEGEAAELEAEVAGTPVTVPAGESRTVTYEAAPAEHTPAAPLTHVLEYE